MNVYIVGAGAVGTFLGHKLQAIGNDVVYAPRDLAAVEPQDVDLAIVATKSFDTPGAIETLRRAVRDPAKTTIVTPQNGVGNEETLAAAFGAERILACALTVPVGIGDDGQPVAANGGGIAFAPVDPAKAHNWVLAAFGATGLKIASFSDYRSLKWSKLALNIVANAACAILNVLPERLVHLNDVFALEIRAIREVRAVMKALDIPAIDLPRYPVRALQGIAGLPTPLVRIVLANRVAGGRGRKPPSLLLDLRAAKNRTEVDVLNGAVAAAARRAGVGAPVNTVFARVVSDIAAMPQLWPNIASVPMRSKPRCKPKSCAEAGRWPQREAARVLAKVCTRIVEIGSMRHPAVPESLDSWCILHRMFRFERRRYAALEAARKAPIEAEAVEALGALARQPAADLGLAQMLGHKADLMFTHYAKSFDELGALQMRIDKIALSDYLEPVTSYVSILELGLYEATGKIHAELRDRGLKPHSSEWTTAFDDALAEQARNPRNAARLWAEIPRRRYVCFYPMDKKRGEAVNWYMLPYEQRAALMLDHGKIGRSFHGLVTQVISGSIGFDDWEWGVDLYADDPLVFKKLIYEMRFDEASARYAAFGPFYTGMQFAIAQLPVSLRGEGVPALAVEEAGEPVLH